MESNVNTIRKNVELTRARVLQKSAGNLRTVTASQKNIVISPPTSEEIMKQRQMENLLKDDLSLVTQYLDERNVTDVAIVDSGEIIVTRFGQGRQFTGVIVPTYLVERIIKACASINEKTIDTFSKFPVFEGTIPKYDARITGLMPPAVIRPQIQIRKPPRDIFTLEQYVQAKYMTENQYQAVVEAIRMRKNLLVCGSTGSGKTTFTNAVIFKMQEFTPNDNFYIVEDNAELQCTARMKTKICVDKDFVRKAVTESLRFSPDRIIFGEVRTADVMMELLDAWKTGHSGNVTTVHANNCKAVLLRIRGMMAQAGDPESANHLSEMVQMIVHLSHARNGVVVDEIMHVTEETDREMSEK